MSVITGLIPSNAVVEKGDIVFFENDKFKMEYEVDYNFLRFLSCENKTEEPMRSFSVVENDALFKALDMDRGDFTSFLSDAYGYDSKRHAIWPACREYDFHALTRAINKIYSELFNVPHTVCTMHFSVGEGSYACGIKGGKATTNTDAVTCKNCLRTKAYLDAATGSVDTVRDLLKEKYEYWSQNGQSIHCRFFLSDGKTITHDRTRNGNHCHGSMAVKGHDYVATLREPHRILSSEDTKAYEEWLINESPYSDVFVDTSEWGWIVDMKKPGNIVSGACIALRYLFDTSMKAYVPIWNSFIKAGFKKNAAFLFMHLYEGSDLHKANFMYHPHWHNAVSLDVEMEYLINFINSEPQVLEDSIFNKGSWKNVMATWGDMYSDEDGWEGDDLYWFKPFKLSTISVTDSMGIKRTLSAVPFAEFDEYASIIFEKAKSIMPFVGAE